MKFYQKTWFIILSLFCFAPLGLFLMWRYKPTWSKGLKGVLTGFFCIWFFCFLIGSHSDTPSEPANSDAHQTVFETQTMPTERHTALTTEPTTEVTTEAPSTTEPSATESKTSAGGQAQSGTNTGGSHASQSGGQSSNKQSDTKVTTTQNRSKETTTQNPDAQVIVYITKTGKRYHNENPCGNGTYYPISLEEAKARGYTPCEKCVLH